MAVINRFRVSFKVVFQPLFFDKSACMDDDFILI